MEHSHIPHGARRIRRSRPARHLLTIEQIRHLLETAQGHPLNALFTLAITTGLRRGELIGLTWQDLETEHQLLHVRRMVLFNGKSEMTDTARIIALSNIALHALLDHYRAQEETRAAVGEAWQDLDLIFPNPCGQSLNPGALWRQSRALFAAAGGEHLHFHELRLSATALLLKQGVSAAVVQTILGMRSLHHPLSILTPVSLSQQREAMQLWDELLAENPPFQQE
jgi:integrase